MGGKTATSTQQVAIPQQVLAQYQAVNQQAEQTAQTPFQSYPGEFVAPVNAEQTSGIAGTNTYAQEAQPYYGAATGVLGASQSATTPVNQAAESQTAASSAPLTQAQIDQYLSPYLKDVVGSEAAVLNQNNQQQQAGQLGNAITSGAFGGDRTGIAAANLEQQQNLANAQIYSGLLNQGYNTALGTATTEQGIGLQGAGQLAGIGQTAYGEGANTASELGSLGAGAQSAGLSGSQAQIAAGTVQQQTQQAQDTAQYNQFLQQQSYPFQVDQFLASIAEGTGALSGSTTTTQQPGGFFSDERLKEDMEPIGKTFDGQPIYRYKMKGDSRDRIGLSAQKVEKKHPDAVGLAGGFRWVDYGKATDEAANRGHFYSGGVAGRRIYAYGGAPDSGGLDSVLAAQQNMYASGQGGQQRRDIQAPAASHQLTVASGTPTPGASGSNHVSQAVGLGKDVYKGYKWATKPSTPGTPANADPGNTAGAPSPSYDPSSAGTTNFETPAEAPSSTTTFDAGLQSADTSGLGAADTAGAAAPAASDAAGAGAADAAAGAGSGVAAGAAGDAAAGAAGGAAAGVAGGAAADAAGTEAAALAAEYAAAYAAAAAAAAKRGGRIRSKWAYGGTPYETGGDQLDIPTDDQTNAHLQSPGPLEKRPTGMQILMKGGQPDQAMNTTGSIFSNEALARGGVAGRHGYDDGGTATDDSDTSPEIASDADRGAGVVGSKGADGINSGGGLWNAIKKHATAENVIPILTGLAAMGTAPTRSPGVALAAGLGAGSQSYLDTRASLARTAEEQQKVHATEIANQLAAMKLGVAQKAFAPQSAGIVPRQTAPVGQQAIPATSVPPTVNSAPTLPSSDAEQTAAGLAAQYRNQFFVNKARTPEEQAAKDEAIKKDWAVGGTMFQSQADNDYQARVDRDLQNSRNTAQQLADQRYAQYNNAATPAGKQVALAHYNALRQWTGDETGIEGGIVKNGRTKQPEIGTIAQQGFTPTDESRFMQMALEPMDVKNPADGTITQMEAWKAHNAASPAAYAQSLKVNSTVPKSAPAAARVSTRAAPAATPAASPAGVTSSGPGVIGTSQSPIALEQQKMNLAALEQARSAGDQAPNNRNINQQLLQLSATTDTGPGTAAWQKGMAALQMPSGSRYQEINAYLDRQAATQATAMGVPHTNAGLAASQTATGTTEYTPQALQEKVKYADALNSGTMAYREGLDKAVGTGGTPNLQKYQSFRSAWAKNFDPDIYRVEDAQRRGDSAELNAIRTRLGSRGMKVLAQKSANLRALENGQIPP